MAKSIEEMTNELLGPREDCWKKDTWDTVHETFVKLKQWGADADFAEDVVGSVVGAMMNLYGE